MFSIAMTKNNEKSCGAEKAEKKYFHSRISHASAALFHDPKQENLTFFHLGMFIGTA